MEAQIDPSDTQNLLISLNSEYEALIDTRKKLADECQGARSYIQGQVEQIKLILTDIEKLKVEISSQKLETKVKQEPFQNQEEQLAEQQEEPINFVPLVDEVSIKHPFSVSLFAEIMDQAVICSTAFSPDGKNLAIGSDKIVRIYNFESDVFILEAPVGRISSNHVRSIAWSIDSKLALCGAEDSNIYVFRVNSSAEENSSEPEKEIKGGDGEIFQVITFPDGKRFASSNGKGIVMIWDFETYTCTAQYSRDKEDVVVTSISISKDQRILAAGYSDTQIIFWDIVEKKKLFEQKCHDDGVYSVLFLPNSDRFVTSSLDMSIKIWDIKENCLELWKTLDQHTEYVLTLAIDPTGQWLISGSKDLSCIVTRLDEGRMLYRLKNHQNSIITVAFNPRGKMFCTGSGDKYVKVWNYATEDTEE